MNDTELRLACLELATSINGGVQDAEQMYKFVTGGNKTIQEDDTTDIHEITAKEMMDIHTAVNEGSKAARDHYLNKFIDQKELLLSGNPINRAMLLAVMDFTLHRAVKISELEGVVNLLINTLPPDIMGNKQVARHILGFKANTTM
jgi:hypothetical protein